MRAVTLERLDLRIARVLALLSERLDEDLPLERLASEAALSPFHFHRTWRALVGEPIGATVRRLRLERAAHQLSAGAAPVTQIALAVGFASTQAFATAFREATGVSPSAWRATRKPGAPLRAEPSAVDAPMRVEIVELEPFTIIAHRHVGAYDTEALAAAFGVPWAWAVGQDLLGRIRGIWGRPWDDPASVAEDGLRYDAGFDLGDGVEAPAHLERLPLGSAPFARIRVHGSYEGLEPAYQHLLGAWLLESGREPADSPILNRFHNDPDTTPEADLVTDVHLPLKPL